MADAWTENDPVSSPPRGLAYAAAALVLILAAVGSALGFQAAERRATVLDAVSGASPGAEDDTLIAKPIVDLTPAPPPPAAADDKAKADAADDTASKADALAEQTARAQAVQAKPSNPTADIDDILTSPTEKAPAAAKAPAAEAPPNAPVKSDVPF